MPAQDLRGFSEKVALVTGAGTSVGRAVALQLALQGAFVVAQHSPAASAEAVSAIHELRELGTLVHAVEADAATTIGAQAMLAEVMNRYDRLDLLVNAAGTERHADLDPNSDDYWNYVMNNTVRSASICTGLAAQYLVRRPSPAVVSIAADRAWGIDLSSTAAIGALTALTRVLARELGPKIRVNCVIGRTLPGLGEIGQDGDPRAPVAATDAARSVIYLLSSDAKTVSGQILSVGAG